MANIKMAGRQQNMGANVEKLMKNVDLGERRPFLDHVYLGCTHCDSKPHENKKKIEKCLKQEVLLEQLNNDQGVWEAPRKNSRVVLRHGRSCENVR